MRSKAYTHLRKEIEHSFGRKITSSTDCNHLVEEIYKHTGFTVNNNTLRRFFGLVKSDYQPSASTINILSRYCGFSSIDEIEKRAAYKSEGQEVINQEEIVRYLVALFEHAEVSSQNEKIFYSVIEQTSRFQERNPAIIDPLQREIAKISNGQIWYFEKLVNIDRLNGYYGEGLHHYLRAKNNNEGKAFANSIQVFRYWLTHNTAMATRHFQEIAHITITQHYPAHIAARTLAARLYHAHLKKEAPDKILAEAKKYQAAMRVNKLDKVQISPEFDLIICEALLLTGHYEEGLEYVYYNKPLGFLSIGKEYEFLFSFWEDFANYKKGRPVKKQRLEIKNKPLSIYSLGKRYLGIIELLLNSASPNRRDESSKQIQELVEQTGFKQLLSLSV